MKVKLVQVGKTEEGYLEQGISVYKKRLQHYAKTEEVTVKSPAHAAKQGAKAQKKTEGEEILKHVAATDKLVLLDEKGKEYTSAEFARYLEKESLASVKTLVFVIGGPYGFSEEVYSKAAGRISLSRMTFSHQMIRLFFWEQLYRAFTILKGEKYHHE